MATNRTGNRKPSSSANVSRSYSELYKNAAAGAKPVTPVVAKESDRATVVLKGSDDVNWRGEYSYVLKDLRTLGLITAILVAVIVVVGLFV